MSKFIKRIRKKKKHPENCVLIGDNFGHLDEFCDLFNNVFSLVVSDEQLKKRNLIYRQDFKELSIIPQIDFIFVDYIFLEKISEITNVIEKFRSTIYINHGCFLDEKFSKFFGKLGYEITDINNDHQIWTPKK
jgi:hypothetical protein